ncbi:peptidoglycan-associated lipoprotein Pal [Acidicapsa dinghuensis]|uniref:Peptidoglycan-associated lipoprotein n=1 Tax=Acidicapsa dinghuensis TaxID=2218256 RepID=A0ABW1EGL3_9BACT|nr:peptidoglycan-associated lipoprotein Pal [Acidicapsa dinghuensis]
MSSRTRVLTCLVMLAAVIGFAGCKKKSAAGNTTPPGMNGPTPTAQLTATPNTITAGDQVVLSWRTTDATSVSIDGIGDVPSSGVKTVTPTESTSYHLLARGDGGTADATARVTVNQPQNAVAVPNNMDEGNLTEEQRFKQNVQDIFFDYDSYDVRGDAQATMSKSAAYLAQNPNIKVLIGGYCDERGSNEYNLTLGQSRADSAKKALIQAGVSPDRIRTISYGKEKPFCTESTEECWQQNRRAGFTIDR